MYRGMTFKDNILYPDNFAKIKTLQVENLSCINLSSVCFSSKNNFTVPVFEASVLRAHAVEPS